MQGMSMEIWGMGFREKLEEMEFRVREGVGENGRKKEAILGS